MPAAATSLMTPEELQARLEQDAPGLYVDHGLKEMNLILQPLGRVLDGRLDEVVTLESLMQVVSDLIEELLGSPEFGQLYDSEDLKNFSSLQETVDIVADKGEAALDTTAHNFLIEWGVHEPVLALLEAGELTFAKLLELNISAFWPQPGNITLEDFEEALSADPRFAEPRALARAKTILAPASEVIGDRLYRRVTLARLLEIQIDLLERALANGYGHDFGDLGGARLDLFRHVGSLRESLADPRRFLAGHGYTQEAQFFASPEAGLPPRLIGFFGSGRLDFGDLLLDKPGIFLPRL